MKKMQPKQRGIWEARVTQGYRLTFRVDGELITMRRVGTHDLLRTP
jgi:mRNA-degrading endonuclease YafQ of YafQ-DinJ toxin-antitoxin module